MSSRRQRHRLGAAYETWVWVQAWPTRRLDLGLESLNTVTVKERWMLHTQIGWHGRNASGT